MPVKYAALTFKVTTMILYNAFVHLGVRKRETLGARLQGRKL